MAAELYGWLIYAGIVLIACIVIAFLIAYYGFGRRAIFGRGNTLDWTECLSCTGGAQYWNGETWGPIPPRYRIATRGREEPVFHPPLANVRNCPHCQAGGWWHEKEGKADETDDRTDTNQ